MLTWRDGLRGLARRPRALYNRLRVVAWNGHFRNERERWLSRLTGASDADVRGFIREIECDREFVASIRNAFRRHTAYLPLPTDFMVEPTGGGSMFFHLVTLYALLRMVRPRTVVETGGTVLRRLGCVDVFIHDSDHSYSHMQWEFRLAFPFLRTGGYLWSDDILGNAAWDDFCREAGLDGRRFLSQGVARKP